MSLFEAHISKSKLLAVWSSTLYAAVWSSTLYATWNTEIQQVLNFKYTYISFIFILVARHHAFWKLNDLYVSITLSLNKE
jgi:hypothetical protein